MHTFEYKYRCSKKGLETKYPLIFNEIKLSKSKTSNWPPTTVVKNYITFLKLQVV